MSELFQAYFDRYFKQYKDKRIAIYGIGTNSRRIAEKIKGYKFVCLIAKDHIGEIRYGLDICSIEDALKISDLIIIAALPESTPLIYQRIRQITESANIPVLDMWGHILSDQKNSSISTYYDENYDQLVSRISDSDVISFDLFDTLITRKAYNPGDVFEYVERELNQKHHLTLEFAKYRKTAEEKLEELGDCPTYDDIYSELLSSHSDYEEYLRDAKLLEYTTELKLLIPRKKMIEAFRYAKCQKKTVIITSDMYYKRRQIVEIMRNCGIYGEDEVFVSCEKKETKVDGGLFEEVVKAYSGKRILHIGDHHLADWEIPIEAGIEVFRIWNPKKQFETSSISYVKDSVHTLEDRLLLGCIISELFNNPFSYVKSKGKVEMNSLNVLGNVCFAACAMQFLSYIIQTVKDSHDGLILFGSRDGYFLWRMYRDIAEKNKGKGMGEFPDGIYLYTSRIAASRAAITDLENIKVFLCSINERLNFSKYVKERFDIETPDEFNHTVGELKQQYGEDALIKLISPLEDKIKNKLKDERENYLKYLSEVLPSYEKAYLVDIMTRGTIVYSLNTLCDQKIKLIALGGHDLPNEYIPNTDDIFLLYDTDFSSSKIYMWYPLIEMVFSSKEPQLLCFSEDGKPIFLNGTEYNPELITLIQEGMEKIISEFPDEQWWRYGFSSELPTELLDVLFHDHSEIDPKISNMFELFNPIDADDKDKSNILERIK